MLQRLNALVAKTRSDGERSLFHEFLRFGSSTAFVRAARVGSGLVVAALVDPAAWGNWYLLNLIVAYGALTQLGVMNGMNREVPAAMGSGNTSRALNLRRTALAVVLLTTGVATLLLLVASVAIPAIGLSDKLLLTLGLLFATQLYTYATTSLRSTTHFADLSRLQLIEAFAHPIFAVGGAALKGIPGFIIGQAIALGFTMLIASRAKNVIWRPMLDRKLARQLISVGFPIMLVGLVHTLFVTVDRWVIGASLGSEALGHYSLAIMALNAVGLLPQVISQQFYPRMAFSWSAEHDPGTLRGLASRQRTFTYIAVVPAVGLVALLASPVVHTLLPHYVPGISAILVTVLIPLVTTIGEGYGGILHVLNRQYWYMGAVLIAALVNVAASVALVGPLGMVGVALGTFFAFTTLAALRVALGATALRRALTTRT